MERNPELFPWPEVCRHGAEAEREQFLRTGVVPDYLAGAGAGTGSSGNTILHGSHSNALSTTS